MHVLVLAGVALAYAGLAEITFPAVSAGVAAFVPASGLTLACLALLERRLWPAAVIGIAAGHCRSRKGGSSRLSLHVDAT